MAQPTPQPPTSSPEPPSAFSPRVQASLFFVLIAFLGIIAWKTWQPAPNRAPTVASGRIDLNHADKSDLLLLRGIGPELADRIIAYRDEHGPFEGLHDLRKVSGMGPAKIEQIRSRVVLSWDDRQKEKTAGTPVMTISPAALPMKSADTSTILDPNRATLEQLQTLPGIGPKLAQRIVDYRSTKLFHDISELRKVPGIGPKTLDKIKPRLQIGSQTAVQ